MLYEIGYLTRRMLEYIGSIFWLLLNTIEELGDNIRRGRLPFRLSMLFEQTDRTGVGSIPLVLLVSFFLGLTMALLTGYQLEKFGTERLVPTLITITFTRELGPLLTGVVLAARIGAAYTAELGTMLVSEEVEAIEAMGIGPLRFLVAPRLVAISFLMPCLSVLSCVAAILGSAFISWALLNLVPDAYFEAVLSSLIIRDIVIGVFKAAFFGLLIGLISCFQGLTVIGGAEGVGRATTDSVVISITTVIGFDTLFNIMVTRVTG
ncbi:MAG: ABC transporter permease [Verrucomicrobia bacterium]|nr:ABC transporter permease [Verrucomicrobiota bacterium]